MNTPANVPLECIDIWFQDEARFGQQNQTTRLWALTGTRPSAVKQQQFEYGYLFGAVCPGNGEGEVLVMAKANKEAMTEYLRLISNATPKGRHSVVIIDGAAWTLKIPHHYFLTRISIIKLPPYSPELNPMEKVWQWLCQRCLSNRVFDGYDEIVEQVSRAWTIFTGDPKRVTQLCNWDWIIFSK